MAWVPMTPLTGTDVAASEFYLAQTKLYDLDFKNQESSAEMKKTAEQLMEVYKDLGVAPPHIALILTSAFLQPEGTPLGMLLLAISFWQRDWRLDGRPLVKSMGTWDWAG